jgi:2-succinyl-6-hydroxy-2,4-cyclohexadiene-1-carboxylate synthase
VALHGFTLHGGQFSDLAALLDRPLVAPDLPGHGESAGAPARYGDAVDAIAAVMRRLGPPLPLTGYSQGGRIALGVALEHPALVSHLALISASPGIADPAAREARRRADEDLAARIERDGLGAFLDEWLENPAVAVAGVDPGRLAADRRLRETNTAPGLAAALRGMGQGAQPPLRDRLGELAMPVVLVCGERDRPYTALAVEMAGRISAARVTVVPAAGHNPVLEAPGAVAAALAALVEGAPPLSR